MRNKLIKLADKSEAGWGAVEEYMADDLASDSDDDNTKIRKAQTRAAAKKKKVQTRRVGKPYQRKAPVSTSPLNPASVMAGFSSQGLFRRPFNTNYRSFNTNYQPTGPEPTDLCFACAKPSHWCRNCPNGNKGSNKDDQL